MTTTGGPGHDVDPVVLDHDAPLDGDDIVVEPDSSGPQHPRRRTRELIVGVVVAAIVVAAIAVALATRHDSGGNTKVSSSAPPATPAADNTAAQPAPRTKQTANANVAPGTTTGVNVVHPMPQAPPPVTPNVGSSSGSLGSPPAAAPTTPTPTLPPTAPPSALHWIAAPATLSITAGGHGFLTVTVVNPTGGTVTLPHPLSCAPALRPVNGAPIGGFVCAEMAQLLAPHSQVVAHYTIYATDTGDASGAPLAEGKYLANVEDLHDVKVTITAN